MNNKDEARSLPRGHDSAFGARTIHTNRSCVRACVRLFVCDSKYVSALGQSISNRFFRCRAHLNSRLHSPLSGSDGSGGVAAGSCQREGGEGAMGWSASKHS
jgi:hypothetical protein